MKKRIATFCCLMMIQSSVLSAGPLRRASLRNWTMGSERASHSRQDQAPAAAPDTRSWAERHPVWTGAMVGFAAGSLITYAATGSDKKDELFDFSGLRGAAVILFGGISAGVGALAGWGIGRSHNDGYHDRATTVRPSKSR